MAMKTVVITGGTGGLGAAVVPRLAREYRCILLYRSRAPEKFEAVRADLADESSVVRAFDEIGPHDALVHLAGGFDGGSLEATSLDRWRRMLDLNATAAMLAMRESLRRMNDGGRIVAISSVASTQLAAGSLAYNVSKAALNALVRSAAEEVRRRGITVNAILPSAMATEEMRKSAAAETLVPLHEVAETISWLLSEPAAHVTGQLLSIVR
jgi:NAD(P)-dependent dehydrogenase (short-subunit alcohol dehydrogenase family)